MNNMNIIRILNNRLNSNLTPTNHESFNSTFFGNSNKYNRNVFVKVFDSVNKFNTENLITQQLSDRVLETFKINDDGLKYVLVMNDLKPIDLENTVSIHQAYEMGIVLAKFHNIVQPFNGMKEENSYFSKISEDINKLGNVTQKYKLTSLLKEFSNLQPLIENDLNEHSNTVLHGDVGIRNFKIINGALNLIDYERARLGPNYQDFIKLFFQDFKLNNSLISSFLKGYESTSIHTVQLKSWTQQFIIFATAVGIMKYTEKIKDEPFKKIGMQMLESVEDYFKYKKYLISFISVSYGDALGVPGTHYSGSTIMNLYGENAAYHFNLKVNRSRTVIKKWQLGQSTDDSNQFIQECDALATSWDRDYLWKELRKIDLPYRKTSTSTGKMLSLDEPHVSLKGDGNGCLIMALSYGMRFSIETLSLEKKWQQLIDGITLTHNGNKVLISTVLLSSLFSCILKKNSISTSLNMAFKEAYEFCKFTGLQEQNFLTKLYNNWLFSNKALKRLANLSEQKRGNIGFSVKESMSIIFAIVGKYCGINKETITLEDIMLDIFKIGGDTDSIGAIVFCIIGPSFLLYPKKDNLKILLDQNRKLYSKIDTTYLKYLALNKVLLPSFKTN